MGLITDSGQTQYESERRSQTTDVAISFDGATKSYGSLSSGRKKKKIGPIKLEVKRGEVLGFLGPNGSGKTTCIRMMLGLIRPTSGRVLINGFDPISNHVDALRHVAYSPELPNIQAFLTPQELLSLVSHEIGYGADRPKETIRSRPDEVKRVLELVGLLEYADTKIGKLSKGMVQRLSIAQALIGSPKTLILDEPMIGLDPAGAAHFRSVFQEFASEGGDDTRGTVFMSSHIMSEVESLCTSVAIIHGGRILYQGPVDDVIRNVLDYTMITLEVRELSPQIIERIRQIPGVDEVRPNADGEIDILVRGNSDIRPDLSELIVRSGAKLYTIKSTENMLERAYIEALKKDNGMVR
ncbi:MAG TPA: ABC transporter ATP-binding protein [Nitrososphaerales archaeon]|nr:ABC transporter ATP-binding protein [Nitrososphaerales archaeon]